MVDHFSKEVADCNLCFYFAWVYPFNFSGSFQKGKLTKLICTVLVKNTGFRLHFQLINYYH